MKRKITDGTLKYDSKVHVDNSYKLTRFKQSWFSKDSVTVCSSSNVCLIIIQTETNAAVFSHLRSCHPYSQHLSGEVFFTKILVLTVSRTAAVEATY